MGEVIFEEVRGELTPEPVPAVVESEAGETDAAPSQEQWQRLQEALAREGWRRERLAAD